jgi:hypothetical protein
MDFSNILKDFFRDFLLYFVNGAFLLIVFFIVFADEITKEIDLCIVKDFQTILILSFSIMSYVIGHILMSFTKIENCLMNKCFQKNEIKNTQKEVNLHQADKDAYLFFIDRYNTLLYFRRLLFYNLIISAGIVALKTTILCSIFFCYDNECKKIILLLILLSFLLFSSCLMYLLYISNKLNFDERVNKLNFKDR